MLMVSCNPKCSPIIADLGDALRTGISNEILVGLYNNLLFNIGYMKATMEIRTIILNVILQIIEQLTI